MLAKAHQLGEMQVLVSNTFSLGFICAKIYDYLKKANKISLNIIKSCMTINHTSLENLEELYS